MRVTLRDMFWTITLVAVSMAWWIERSRAAVVSVEYRKQKVDIVKLELQLIGVCRDYMQLRESVPFECGTSESSGALP